MYPNGKLKAITLSFDDGVTQDARLIELLDRYGLKCTFNLNSAIFGKPGRLTNSRGESADHNKVDPAIVASLYKNHEVAVHTLTHPNLTTLPDEEIIRQVEEDRKNLTAICGYEVIGMAYPCGGVNNNDHVAKVIKENTGVKYSRTITSTYSWEQQENLYRFNPTVYHIENFDALMDMSKKFIGMKCDKPQIFYIWGHSYEMDYKPDYWVRMEEFWVLISGHEDIFYGTNKEVLL